MMTMTGKSTYTKRSFEECRIYEKKVKKKTAVDKGHNTCHKNDQGVSQDNQKAVEIFQHAADKDDTHAMSVLGWVNMIMLSNALATKKPRFLLSQWNWCCAKERGKHLNYVSEVLIMGIFSSTSQYKCMLLEWLVLNRKNFIIV